jgi:Ca2+-binding RTX toxin-like protein
LRLQLILGVDEGEVCMMMPDFSCQSPIPPESDPNDPSSLLDNDIDCGLIVSLFESCVITRDVYNAVVDALAPAAQDPENDCAELGAIAKTAALGAGASEFVASQFEDYIANSLCAAGFPGAPSDEPVQPDACIGTFNTIMGTADDDILMGTNGRDLIFGLKGNDIIIGANGDDCLVGGDGNDTIEGQNGNDVIEGGQGDDELHGDNGDDAINGGDGNDRVLGDNGDDGFDCGAGSDNGSGGNGNDTNAGNRCETFLN